MPPPLRIGIAGLGTVGAVVITLLGRQAEALARQTGRPLSSSTNQESPLAIFIGKQIPRPDRF
jgi:homoserine dehydrogenase